MENSMNIWVDNFNFEITAIFKRQKSTDSRFLEKGHYKYTYYFKTTYSREEITFSIDVEDEKNNNKKYLRKKCEEVFIATISSNQRSLRVGDII